MAKKQPYKNWQLTRDEDDIAWLSIDNPGSKVNTLGEAAIKELEKIVDELDINLPKGLVISSAKQSGFVVGAEIREFLDIENPQQAEQYIGYVHSVFNRIEALATPKVALIHGFCLGGGMELALTCDYLIGENEASCKLGLPEVKLGIHPGFGGTVRMIERIGVPTAMDLMLSGRMVVAFSAKKMGLLDQAVARRYFNTAALDYIRRAPAPKRASRRNKLLRLKPARLSLAKYLKKQISSRANPVHYPAPYALINLWREFGG